MIRALRYGVLVAVALLLMLAGRAGATNAPGAQWQLAKRYYRSAQWDGAALEFLRHGVLFPGDLRCPQGVRMRARSLWHGGRRDEALTVLSDAVDDGSDKATGTLLTFMLMERGHHRLAAYRLRQLAGDAVPSHELRFLQGWNDLQRKRINAAQVHFASVTGGPYAPAAKELLPRLGGLQTERIKSPGLSGWLSFVVPGAGQAYCGHWWEAAGSLGINALAGWWIYTMIEREQYWSAAGIYAFGGIRYHLGGALQAHKAAKRINRKHIDARVESLKKDYGYMDPTVYE